MVTVPEAHDVAIQGPWYAPASRQVAIHRYLDPGFVAQFQADASNSPQSNPTLFGWEQEDRMPPSQGSLLKLRRPVHRTFHVVAWEACCKMPTAPSGQPAVAPEKIAAAGFVVRTGSADAPQGFQIVQGKPSGWSAVEPKADPDAARQVKALGLVPRQAIPNPGYTGEETFPLHPLAVQDGDTPHTLLYGYLPIGGGDYVPPAPATPPGPDLSDAAADDLLWPFGLYDRSSGPVPDYSFDLQIASDTITIPDHTGGLGPALAVMLGRYQLADLTVWSDPLNAPIVAVLDTLNFFADPPIQLSGQPLRDWAAATAVPGSTLGAVLRDYAVTQAPDGSGQTNAQVLLGALMGASAREVVTLPGSAKLHAGAQNLLVTDSVAAQLRAALRLRLAQAVETSSSALPLPKLISGPGGRYIVVPFVRTVKPDGCEKIFWGNPSDPFAVAALFDPDAARPSLIEMPSLADAKKGAARGATFDLPKDLADLMNSLSNNQATQNMMTGKGSQSGGLGIRLLCSFSLPVITICAMILLSVIIGLLNIFLGWMAWVKICLPWPANKAPS
ncbi:MAG TPA: hypothetical protein VKI44_21535 [Acetobacteraceae bacterium]|nr:hypothetical protein [Acetobacteraceae bacterium]